MKWLRKSSVVLSSGLLLLGLLASSLGSVLVSSRASAASAYDTALNTLPAPLMMSANNYRLSGANYTCSPVDIGSAGPGNWSALLLDDAAYFGPTSGGYPAARDALQASFTTAVANGSWGVSLKQTGQSSANYPTYGAGYTQNVLIYWSETVNTTATWNSYTSGSTSNTYVDFTTPTNSIRFVQLQFGFAFTAGTPPDCDVGWSYADNTTYDSLWTDLGANNWPVSNSQALSPPTGSSTGANNVAVWNYFIANVDWNYPSGYEGETGVEDPDDFVNQYPPVKYFVTTENVLNATFDGGWEYCINTELGACLTPLLRWQIFDPDDNELVNTVSEIYAPFTFTLPGIDEYTFVVSFVHPGPPYALFDPAITLLPTVFTVNANGTYVSGGTGINECEVVSGQYVCGEADPLEDCSTYGTDIGGYIQCITTNFGIWLRNSLIDLFLPRYSFFTSYKNELDEFFESKLGFINQTIAIVIDLFEGIIVGGATTSCTIAPPGTIFDQTFEIDVCTFEDIAPTPFSIIQGLIIALTIIALAFAGVRKYQELVDHR